MRDVGLCRRGKERHQEGMLGGWWSGFTPQIALGWRRQPGFALAPMTRICTWDTIGSREGGGGEQLEA
jgi:hypothetical protein